MSARLSPERLSPERLCPERDVLRDRRRRVWRREAAPFDWRGALVLVAVACALAAVVAGGWP